MDVWRAMDFKLLKSLHASQLVRQITLPHQRVPAALLSIVNQWLSFVLLISTNAMSALYSSFRRSFHWSPSRGPARMLNRGIFFTVSFTASSIVVLSAIKTPYNGPCRTAELQTEKCPRRGSVGVREGAGSQKPPANFDPPSLCKLLLIHLWLYRQSSATTSLTIDAVEKVPLLQPHPPLYEDTLNPKGGWASIPLSPTAQ